MEQNSSLHAISWRKWCRLCARVPSAIDIFSKQEDGSNCLAELLLKYIHLKTDPLDGLPLSICSSCYQFVLSVARFADRVAQVDAMYASLACNDASSLDSSCIKLQFGLVKEEPPFLHYKCDKSTDTLDLCFEWEEQKFDPLEAQEHKEDIVADVSINNLPDIVNDDSDSPSSLASDKSAYESEESPHGTIGTDTTLRSPEESEVSKKNQRKRKMQYNTCEFCDESFPLRRALRRHKKTAHAAEMQKEFMCEICAKSFMTKFELKNHNYTHTNDTPYKCSTCNKHFSNKPLLKQHEDIHSGTAYVCSVCGLVLNTKSNLNRHMVVHSDQKKFKCTVCSREFKRFKTLKAHTILHTGLKPYNCPFCDKTFSTGSHCRSHKKKIHPVELAAMEAAGIVTEKVRLPELKDMKPQAGLKCHSRKKKAKAVELAAVEAEDIVTEKVKLPELTEKQPQEGS